MIQGLEFHWGRIWLVGDKALHTSLVEPYIRLKAIGRDSFNKAFDCISFSKGFLPRCFIDRVLLHIVYSYIDGAFLVFMERIHLHLGNIPSYTCIFHPSSQI